MKAWSEDMGEISGFGKEGPGGASYEAGCRALVLAGIEWIDEHPDADPRFKGWEGVYGVLLEDNDTAKALTRAMMDAQATLPDGSVVRLGDEATGAMHHTAINHIMAYKRLGWEKYCQALRKAKLDEEINGA